MKCNILEEIHIMIAILLNVIDVMPSLESHGDLWIVGSAKLIFAEIVIDLEFINNLN